MSKPAADRVTVSHFLRALSRRSEWAGGPPIANILMAKTLAQPDIISLAAGFVEQRSLPVEPVEEAFRELWQDRWQALAALQYGSTIGYLPLREAILEEICRAEEKTAADLSATVDRIVVTAGSNQLLHLVAETLLDPGDVVLCGSPSYYVFLGMLESFGARPIGVATDADGLVPEALEERLELLDRRGELSRVKAIYVTSYFDNPTGVSLAQERRSTLVEIAQRWSRRHRIYIIEDWAYRDLRYWGQDLPSVRAFDQTGETVVVAGSFSKSFSPGLRVGWGLLPETLLEPVLSLKGHLDFGSANFNQMLMAEVLRSGRFERHRDTLRQGYRQKVEVVVQALEERIRPIVEVEYAPPRGGLYVWLRLPETFDTGVDGPLFQKAVEEGVLYVPGEFCYPREGEAVRRCCLRLSFAMPDLERLKEGIERLARAIKACCPS